MKMKRSRKYRHSSDWHRQQMELSPKHAADYIARREFQLRYLDNLNEQERALVYEYGFDRAFLAIRQFYGRPAEARRALEAERRQLQVVRWGNITPR